MYLDLRSIQHELAKAGHYAGRIDGDFGPASRAARDKALAAAGLHYEQWHEHRRMVAIQQWTIMRAGIPVGTIDGLWGPSSAYALEQWQNKQRSQEPPRAIVAHQPEVFPRQRDMLGFYGAPGTNHVSLELPYPMRIAWDLTKSVEKITINKHCAESAHRAFSAALAHYGYDKIKAMGLDLFGGCYANRPMRGGTNLSTHAFAAALDIDPENNQLRWGADRARMAKPEYAAFLDCFEAEGWVSLGRERNYDWMHLQAARL